MNNKSQKYMLQSVFTERALQRASKEGKESLEFLPEYPTDSNMKMETIMKRPEVNLEDTKDADKWKSKVMNMLESKFASIVPKSPADIGKLIGRSLKYQ